MLSKAIHHSINLIMKIGRNLAAFPFEWDPKLHRAKSSNKAIFIRWCITLVYIFINTTFMTVRLIQASCCMNFTYGKLFMNLFNVITWLCGSAFQINNIIHRHEYIEFINHLMKTNEHFEQISNESNVKMNHGGSTAKKFTYAIYIYSVAQFFVALRTLDQNPKYFFTLTGIQVKARWKLIPLALFECYMSFNVATVLLMYVIFFLSYVKSTAICLEIMHKQEHRKIPIYFRMLQAVNNQFNLCYHYTAMPFVFFTLMTINVLSDYATVRLYTDVPMPGYLGFPMTAIATMFIILDTFPASYKIYEGSEEIIRKSREKSKLRGFVHTFLKSCKPLGVQVGSYFHIKQITIMTFLGIIIDNAIMLLLSF